MLMTRVTSDFDETSASPKYRVRVWTPPSRPLSSWFMDVYDLGEEAIGDSVGLQEILRWISKQESQGIIIELFIRASGSLTWTRIYGNEPEETYVNASIVLTKE